MPNPQPPLLHGKYFHIYNRGINGCNLFTTSKNYQYFLTLYDKYITEVAETYAWVLMPNHFHFLVRIMDKPEIGLNPRKQIILEESIKRIEKQTFISSSDFNPAEDFGFQKFNPKDQFSNLFNAYAQAFNHYNSRTGSLFEHTFHRKQVDNESYFKNLVLYIHFNPVHHGFCSHPIEYPWSSYITCISKKKTKLQRDAVIGWFKTIEDLISMHEQGFDDSELDQWIGI